ncbi:sensor domain-containing protein [[Mycobacterium] burgundiense]|uniref:Sensor domain-containing protein n=1 Tax=[Mycobacterium] burgundiense TaxID=3064286 RepID=A0ABM9LYG2_9MYCO|nr:sensor domain-containing protein [Mycolicibacterium sp. MU0053]CAJ1506909.1 sensor domain-containing protein [Mycolicibacterium sp. MU0053]
MSTPGYDTSNDQTVHIPPRGANLPGPQPSWPAPNWPPHPGVPPWQPPPRPRAQRLRWVAVSAAVVIGAATLGSVLVANRDEPAPNPPAAGAVEDPSPQADPSDGTETPDAVRPVPVAALSGLLLNLPEAAAVVGSATMAGSVDSGERIYEAMADEPLVDNDCIALYSGKLLAYRGSGFTASRQQFLTGDAPRRKLVQTVVSFADPAAAQRHVSATRAKWDGCANRTVNLAVVGATAGEYWAVQNVTEDAGILSTTTIEEAGDGWLCRNALAARNNIVLDFAICGTDVPESAVPAFVDKVAGKIARIRD